MINVQSLSRRVANSLFNTPSLGAWVEPVIQLSRPGWRAGRHSAVVTGVQRYAFSDPGHVDLIRVTLRPASAWSGFQSGQHIQLTTRIQGALLTRTFSLCSTPARFRETGLIEVAIKRQASGRVTEWLCDWLTEGNVLHISEAQGDFQVKDPAKPALFIAGGTGITPLLSMAGTLVTQSTANVRMMVYTRSGEAIFEDALKVLERRSTQPQPATYAFDVYQLINGLVRPQSTGFAFNSWETDASGHFCLEHLLAFCPDFGDREIYICGPIAMIRSTSRLLIEQGVQPHQIHFELFSAGRNDGTRGDAVVRIQDGDQRYEVQLADGHGQTLLEVAESQGLQPHYGCRQGVCHECKCTKRSGRVYNRLTQQWSDSGEEEIQLCVSIPEGEVELSLAEPQRLGVKSAGAKE